MPTWPNLIAFTVASFVLAVTPGPGVAFLLARTVAEGRRAGMISVLGVALGNLLNASAAGVLLYLLVGQGTWILELLRYAGAAYLFFLGGMAFSRAFKDAPRATIEIQPSTTLLRDSFIVAVSNPKTLLFFAGFIPQFISPGDSVRSQVVLLGLVFAIVAACSDTAYVLAAVAVQKRFARNAGWQRGAAYAQGAVFIGLGVMALVWGSVATPAQ